MKKSIIIIFLLSASAIFGQEPFQFSAGTRVSFLFSIGSHQSDIGLSIQGYAAVNYLQINAGTTFRYFGNNLGERCHFGEWRHELGAVALFGRKNNPVNLDFSGALHQSSKPYSLGYAYLWYFDKVGTSQRSGTWNIGIQRVDIQLENDVFAGQAKDRFRTGNLAVSYRNNEYKSTIGLQIWTGESRYSVWNKTSGDKMPNGYRDLSPLPYGYKNHGILYGELKYLSPWNQRVGGRIGWDSEQIRHIFQNRISHDLVWLPKKMERNTPHYPRLDAYGNPVFNRKEARKPVPYFQIFLNDGGLY